MKLGMNLYKIYSSKKNRERKGFEIIRKGEKYNIMLVGAIRKICFLRVFIQNWMLG